MSVMMGWILSFAPEDVQKQCQSAGSWIWPWICAWKNISSNTCTANLLQLCRLCINFINYFKASDCLQLFARRVFLPRVGRKNTKYVRWLWGWKKKINLLNTAQGALLYIIWIVAGVMKLINHWKSRWRWNQQFPIRTVLCITQNLYKGEYQSLVVFF